MVKDAEAFGTSLLGDWANWCCIIQKVREQNSWDMAEFNRNCKARRGVECTSPLVEGKIRRATQSQASLPEVML